ncbi:hypothetical protein NXW19_10915 [Bacteroides ovatus]|jgi:hypothetical protein|uniref:Uncharacterized protein n=1 Tax=Bacteroides ovatus TaxID=28116 RepID=A0AAW6IL38_BACOV|nr:MULTISPECIES: hypothetical protein [Bacteroidaceae]MDC7960284.1 hypothetical protein [Bacteroides ovatus]UVP11393.1 hypothetical protein NXW52_00270 [Bacteroides ovatus]UVP11884.1 hypothetical protein NXW52_03395 [Bacteroides ovatus]UVP75228.1 hypothetical protein NXW19_14075 [Bacteroides ovatus]UVP79128.1 hypothetical protein NXW19_10915 [Bacteroides ovatus]
MDFSKVAACCADTVAFVRVTVFLLVVIIPFSAKKYTIRYPTMDFPEVAACGTGW